jgi:hypothetical protein
MKTLLIVMLLTIGTAKAQTTSYRLGELEKFRTWAKAEFAWFRNQKRLDSITIKLTRDSLNKFKPIYFPDARVVNGVKVDTVYTKQQ